MRIGELAKVVDVPVRTIRYYDDVGLLSTAERTAAGYRNFSGTHVQQVHFIRAARRVGLRLDQIREILKAASGNVSPCNCVRENVQRNIHEIDMRIADLRAMRTSLEETRSRIDEFSPADHAEVICPAIESITPSTGVSTLDSPVDWRV